jgi:hypothetical protein
MRLDLIFFLFLCFNLVGGSNSASAGHHYATITHFESMQAQKSESVDSDHQQYALTTDLKLTKENDDLIFVEDEDEEAHITRKLVSLATCISFFYSFILSHPSGNVLDRLAFCRHQFYASSCKYIAQRVLRI